MWYSNDQPTPTKFRQRTYTITCDNDLTQDDFDAKYKWPIRSVNSQWPKCNFFIMSVSKADHRVEEYLRNELGISPARVTIFYVSERIPDNKFRSNTKEYSNILELEDEFVLYSSHDILWIPPYVPEGITSRILRKRGIKNKNHPFIETEPDY